MPRPREGAAEGRDEQPEEEREPDDARLGGHRHGRRVRGAALRLAPHEPGALGVRPLEAAHADAADRVVERDPDALADEVRPPARDLVDPRAALVEHALAHLRRREGRRGPRRARATTAASSALLPHTTNAAAVTPTESATKLVCENERTRPDPHRPDHEHEPGDAGAPHAAEQHAGERGEDPDDEVATVDRRDPRTPSSRGRTARTRCRRSPSGSRTPRGSPTGRRRSTRRASAVPTSSAPQPREPPPAPRAGATCRRRAARTGGRRRPARSRPRARRASRAR